jgi:hypothetical protein
LIFNATNLYYSYKEGNYHKGSKRKCCNGLDEVDVKKEAKSDRERIGSIGQMRAAHGF